MTVAARAGPGFAVLYRWRLKAGAEDAFIAAWTHASAAFLERGSLGSRLHRGADGIWYSYAQWPSAEARARAFVLPSLAPEADDEMQRAIAETLPALELASVADFMVLPPR